LQLEERAGIRCPYGTNCKGRIADGRLTTDILVDDLNALIRYQNEHFPSNSLLMDTTGNDEVLGDDSHASAAVEDTPPPHPRMTSAEPIADGIESESAISGQVVSSWPMPPIPFLVQSDVEKLLLWTHEATQPRTLIDAPASTDGSTQIEGDHSFSSRIYLVRRRAR